MPIWIYFISSINGRGGYGMSEYRSFEEITTFTQISAIATELGGAAILSYQLLRVES